MSAIPAQSSGEPSGALRQTGDAPSRPSYVNSAQIQISPWDLTITFGQVLGKEDDALLVEPKASVIMSLHHAKAFLDVLQNNLAEYEKRAGEIKWKIDEPKSNP